MAGSSPLTKPIRALHDATTSLEAAVLECLAKPKKQAVHKVRTTTRRIEAQLNLLLRLGGLPPYEEEAGRIRKTLKKLRRAAGAVRDLDVQRELVREEAESQRGKGVRKEARKLRGELKRERQEQAGKLQALLETLHAKLPRQIRALLHALQPAEETALDQTRLTALVRAWYGEESAPHMEPARSGDPNELHAVRKAAKLGRYLAESAPEQAMRAKRLAVRLEALQEAGGKWHDWMQLAELASQQLGDDAELPQRFASHADRALAAFQKKLRYKM